MISNLRFSENAPAYDGCSEWCRYKGNCKFLLRWFRGGFLGLLTIHIPILYLSSFSESNAWDSHLVMTEISGNVPSTSEDFRWITEDFRSLPKIKYPQMFQKTFEHFGSYLKDYLTILKTCFDMISLEHKKGHKVIMWLKMWILFIVVSDRNERIKNIPISFIVNY